MLDFLNLHEEAEILMMLLIVAGIFFTISYAGFHIAPEKNANILGMIMLGISIAACVFACVPGFIMLITFKLKMLVKAVLIALAVDGLFFGFVYTTCFNFRAKKYSKNPVMKEILSFCEKNDVAAILCLHDGVLFLNAIGVGDYCKNSDEIQKEFTSAAFETAKKSRRRPSGFSKITQPAVCMGKIVFADRGYPSLPDVPFFGKVLRKHLNGYGMSIHKVSIQYDEETPGKLTHHIAHVYEDCFVYRKSARDSLRQEERKSRTKAMAEKNQREKNKKTWE